MEEVMRRKTARTATFVAALLTMTAALAILAGAASATSEVVYNDVPASIQFPPGVNAPPYSYEFYKTSEFGAQFGLGGTARKNPKITVVMGSNTCQSGSGASCVTASGAKFKWPVKFNVYSVGPNNSVGIKLAAGSKTFNMPYRPSANLTKCTGAQTGDWYFQGQCLNTPKAFKITLPLHVATPELPNNVIVTFAYNTTSYGEQPTGEPGPYDGLSLAVTESAASLLTVGSNPGLADVNPNEEGLYLSSPESYLYCGVPVPPAGTLALTGLTCPGEPPGWKENAQLVTIKAS
jgi:hypothetical protein